MEKFFVADSYKNASVIGEPFIGNNGKRYIKVKAACPRCGGSGHYSYNQLDGTVCYGCGGSGSVTKNVRAYTEKEYLRMQAANERARAKRQKAKEDRARDLQENAAKYKHELALKMGFNENEKAFFVYGGDTFAIKDSLKSLGARFDPVIKWYFATQIELPEGYKLCEFSFDDIYIYNPNTKFAILKDDAIEIIAQKLMEVEPSDTEFYPAEVGTRLYDLKAKVEKISGFDGAFGYTWVYTFSFGKYVFVWFTTKNIDIEVEEEVLLTGTVKKFEVYKNINQTYLTRCTIK